MARFALKTELTYCTTVGMNDILAKPFTKDGMAKILMKFCGHLLKNPGAPAELELNGNTMLNNSLSTPTYAGVIAPSVPKYDTPINSPATSGSWHSPNQTLAHTASPSMDGTYMQATGINVSNSQMVMTPTGMPGGIFTPQLPAQIQQMPQMAQMPNPQIPRMSNIMAADDRPVKRQRLYPPPGQAAPPTDADYRHS